VEDTKPRCTKCKFLLASDSGYSNYTVEETDLDCLKGFNKDLPAAESYRFETEQSGVNTIAENCPHYTEGEGTHIDVDREDGNEVNYNDDPEVKELLRLYFN